MQSFAFVADSVVSKILMSNWSTVGERGKSKNSSAYNEVFSEPHTCVASQSIMKPVEEYRIISIKVCLGLVVDQFYIKLSLLFCIMIGFCVGILPGTFSDIFVSNQSISF